MSRYGLLILLPALLFALACGGGDKKFNQNVAQAQVEEVLRSQMKAYTDNNPALYYATYTPAARSKCSFEAFSRRFRTLQAGTAGKALAISNTKLTLRDAKTRTADVTFTTQVGTNTGPSSAVFVQVGAKWFEDDLTC